MEVGCIPPASMPLLQVVSLERTEANMRISFLFLTILVCTCCVASAMNETNETVTANATVQEPRESFFESILHIFIPQQAPDVAVIYPASVSPDNVVMEDTDGTMIIPIRDGEIIEGNISVADDTTVKLENTEVTSAFVDLGIDFDKPVINARIETDSKIYIIRRG